MKFARVLAYYKEGIRIYKDYRVILVCGLDNENKIVEGEWFGVYREERQVHPFVITKGKVDYGANYQIFEFTNLHDIRIEEGEIFYMNYDNKECIYSIDNVHMYNEN